MVMSSCALSHPFAGLSQIDSFVFRATESKENPSHNSMPKAKLYIQLHGRLSEERNRLGFYSYSIRSIN